MGCDIHIITQIRKNDSWEYIPEVPATLDTRNYSTFAFLANVRNSFQDEGFEAKGLPDDLGGMKFGFEDYAESINKRYNEGTKTMVKLPDGSYIECNDERLAVKCKTKDEADVFGSWSYHYEEECYTAYDPSILGGEKVDVIFKDLMSYQEFVDYYYEDEWDEGMQKYGIWHVDFECEDYHSHSWLTLKELIDKDKSSYTSVRCKVPEPFYKEFIARGGVLPEGMEVIDEKNRVPGDIMEAIQMSFNPDVIIYWQPKIIDTEKYPILKGIEELKELATKYDITDYDNIRIVFAFDN